MQIRTAEKADEARISEIIALSFPNGSYIETLMKSGSCLPMLTFVAESNGDVIGVIAFCEAELEGTRQLLLSGVCVAPERRGEGAGIALVSHAHKAARELGYGWSLAFDDTKFLTKKAGYELAFGKGILSPKLRENARRMKAFRLCEDAPAFFGFVKLPDELDLHSTEPLLEITTTMNTKQLYTAVFSTRGRDRFIRCALLAAAAIAALVISELFDKPRFVQGALLAVAFLIKSIYSPLALTRKYMKKRKQEFGEADMVRSCFFTDEAIITRMPEYENLAYILLYDSAEYLYLKKEHLFICDATSRGTFLMYKDIPDRDGLIAFIKEKCPKIRVRK